MEGVVDSAAAASLLILSTLLCGYCWCGARNAAAAGTLAPEAGTFWQRQAMAVPANLSDPLLKKWVKPQSNPFLLQVRKVPPVDVCRLLVTAAALA